MSISEGCKIGLNTCNLDLVLKYTVSSSSEEIAASFQEALPGISFTTRQEEQASIQAKESYKKSIEQSFLSELEALLQKWDATIHISGPNDWSSQPHLYIVIDGIYEEQEMFEDDGQLLYADCITIRPEVEFRYVHNQLPKEK